MVESAPLLREYRLTPIEGSNPSLSATSFLRFPVFRFPLQPSTWPSAVEAPERLVQRSGDIPVTEKSTATNRGQECPLSFFSSTWPSVVFALRGGILEAAFPGTFFRYALEWVPHFFVGVDAVFDWLGFRRFRSRRGL